MQDPKVVLVIVLILLFEIPDLSSSQQLKWEDRNNSDSLHPSPRGNVKFDSEEDLSKTNYESVSSNKTNRKGGSKGNEVVAKQYFPQGQPFLQDPQFSGFSQPPGYSNDGWNWQSSFNPGNNKRPGLVQFPGESLLDILPNSNSPTNTIQANNARRNKPGTVISGSAVRIDSTCECGTVPLEKDSKKLQRIVGGSFSKENSWPWMVSIAFIGQTTPFWFCGGSLISERFVLTAAHCLKSIRNFGLANVKLIMGSNNILDTKLAIHYSIRSIRTHPMYKSGTEEYDIALLETKEKVNFTSRVSPICLRQENGDYVNRTVTVAGWGTLQNGDGPPADLREVDLKIVSNDQCHKEYQYHYRTSITSAMICAWLPGKDSCQGDSGGPLFLKTTAINPPAYTQIGIVSFGPPQCGTTTIPGVYSRVSSGVKWIKLVAKSGKFCKGSF